MGNWLYSKWQCADEAAKVVIGHIVMGLFGVLFFLMLILAFFA